MTPLSEWESPLIFGDRAPDEPAGDNYIAEMLIKGLGAQFGDGRGSTTAGGSVVTRGGPRLRDLAAVIDGSGLSRAATGRRRARSSSCSGTWTSPRRGVAFDESLAVVGRNGSVYNRMRGTAAQDRCHAKTGTLHDVSALAGFCDTTGGERVAFAFLMNRVYPSGARALQDRMTVALARYDEQKS